MTYRWLTRGPVEVPAGGGVAEPRQVWQVAEASLEGDGISATLAAPGADWMRVSDDGFWRPDVRLALRTDDGAALTLRYTGLVEQTPAFVSAATEDRETTWEQRYMRMVLQFKTIPDTLAD